MKFVKLLKAKKYSDMLVFYWDVMVVSDLLATEKMM